ncbi:ANTAR domain-containing protein [Streptomyces sp. NPDC049099]|uniref:ANTAR domain-containing protein n=1 Tax=Streptomyces sp. NPDC049099 TaxID=3155768 RepID=UPI003424BBD0
MRSAAHAPHTGRSDTLVVVGHGQGDRIVLRARGELVQGCTDTLAGILAGLPADIARIELDLTEVSFMDSTGTAFLDVLREYGRRHGVAVSATGWRGQPRRVLELMGLDTTDPLRTAPAAGRPARTASAVARERAEQLDSLRLEIAQLRHAIASRPVIDQARGILMAAHGCTPDGAWDILRETSQRSNTKLRRVAAAVTASACPGGPALPEDLRTALRAAVDGRRGAPGLPDAG